MRVPVIKSVV